MTALGPLSHYSDPEDQAKDVNVTPKGMLRGVAVGIVVACVIVSLLTLIAVIIFMTTMN